MAQKSPPRVASEAQGSWRCCPAPLDQPSFSPPPNFFFKARCVPSSTSWGHSPVPNPTIGAVPKERGGQTALSPFLFGCRRVFSTRRDHGLLKMLSLKRKKKKKEKKEGERAHLVCDGQTAYTPSAPTGQLEENIYILTNTNATDGVES